MKQRKVLTILALLMCVLFILPSCGMQRKTEPTTEEEEDPDDTTTESVEEVDVRATMQVDSLDQFISDGSIFAENVPIPTPTPIPVNQYTLGMTNDGNGYYSGPLENATVIDNEFFRYTIFSAELTDTSYVVTGEFENKTDVSYYLYFKNPILDNECSDNYFYSDTIGPHSVMEDVTDFAQLFEDFNGVEPTRISFLLLGVTNETNPDGSSKSVVLSSPEFLLNYVPVNIFPQGEDAFVYQDKPISDDSMILYDSDGAMFAIDYFEVTNEYFCIYYTFLNKTSSYLELRLDDHMITLDGTVFNTPNNSHQPIYVAPYARQTAKFTISKDTIEKAGLDPYGISTVTLPLISSSVSDPDEGIKVLWQIDVKCKVSYG